MYPTLVAHKEIARCDVRAKKVATEQNLVFGQVGGHGFRPVHPRRENKCERLVAKGKGFAVPDHDEFVLRDEQKIHEHGLGLGVGDDLGLRVQIQHQGDGPGMILLRMLGYYVIKLFHTIQMPKQRVDHIRVHSVNERGFLTAVHEIGVVGCPIGERNQGVEQPPVPIHCTNPIH